VTDKRSDQRPLTRDGDFIPVSEIVHGSKRMRRLRFQERLRAIHKAAARGRAVTRIETPIGSDDPVERYPDGELPE
jgi:hypothetical protein